MNEVTTIGLDLAKTVLEVHGVDRQGAVVIRRTLRRAKLRQFFARLPPCLIGMEACATAHYWARALRQLGHDVRLIPPAYARAHVQRNQNDVADAAAICEAVSRPSMRLVAIKSAQQQAATGIHKIREMLINHVRGLMAEFGIVVAEGPAHAGDPCRSRRPPHPRPVA